MEPASQRRPRTLITLMGASHHEGRNLAALHIYLYPASSAIMVHGMFLDEHSHGLGTVRCVLSGDTLDGLGHLG